MSRLISFAPDIYADNEGEQKAHALYGFASALVEAQDKDHAVITLKQDMELAKTIKNTNNKARSIASTLVKIDNKELALETSKQAGEVAGASRGEHEGGYSNHHCLNIRKYRLGSP